MPASEASVGAALCFKSSFYQVISWRCTTSWYEVKTFEVESLFLRSFVVALEPTQKPREKDSLEGL